MRRNLILGATYLLVVVIVGLSVPFAATLSRRLVGELGARVEREAFAVAAAVEDQFERRDTSALQALVESLSSQIGGRVLLTDTAGTLVADSLQPPGPTPPSYASRPEIARALAGFPTWEVRASGTLGYDLLVSAVPIRSRGSVLGTVRVSYPMSQVKGAIHRAYWFLAAVGAATFAIGLLFAWWLGGRAARPLKSAALVARRVASGDLDARVPEQGPPEVRELAHDVNLMTNRLADLLRANREFAANASHQLRTPLAALRLSLEEATEMKDPRAELEHSIRQTDRLSAAIDALLQLGESRERGTAGVELGEVAALAVTGLGPGGPEVEIKGGGIIRGDPERVRQVASNLLDNARRYARAWIRVSVATRGDRVQLAVEDDGPGVPPEERQRVFDRFHRGKNPTGTGSGLGLAVVRELAQADGGLVSCSESDLGGARFIVDYPALVPTAVP